MATLPSDRPGFVTINLPAPSVAQVKAAAVPLREQSDELLRRTQLLLRVILKQGDGSHPTTNAIADDIAVMVVREVRSVLGSE